MLDAPLPVAENGTISSSLTEPAQEGLAENRERPVDTPAQGRAQGGLIITGLVGRVLRPRLAGSDRLGLDTERVQKALTLEDIRVGNVDGRGNRITLIYVAQVDEYVIYQAGEVMVQYADDPGKAQVQRKSILPISALRAEVNALAEGSQCRNISDRQLAYGLQLALDGELDGAKATIAAAKTAILAKRAASGRFQYLKWSFATAALLTVLLFLASRLYPFAAASSDLWLAAKAGLIGAVFSIALGIRGRTVALDTERLDNITDGALRLLIGIIAAGVLLLLFASGMAPSLKIGDAEFKPTAVTWQMVLVIGFVAGFLERLVPDLLDKRNPQGNGATAPRS
jgi:hypothetical protein